MNSPVFFGETEREGLGGGIADEDPSTRGLLESYPHDQIHRAVGGIVISPNGQTGVGAMATPPTAGFDPIFSIHHSNIDRLWMEWSCMPGKQWGKLPPAQWFNEAPWFFYDIDSKVVNEPRRKYFDHRALGIRFKYEDMTRQPLALPPSIVSGGTPLNAAMMAANAVQANPPMALVAESKTSFTVSGAQRSTIVLPSLDRTREALVQQPAGPSPRRAFVRLVGVNTALAGSVGFDVYLTANPESPLTRTDPAFLGSVALFIHPRHDAEHPDGHGSPVSDQLFEITKVLAAISAQAVVGLRLVISPFALMKATTAIPAFSARDSLRIAGLELLVTR
jgi:hypothetical protein